MHGKLLIVRVTPIMWIYLQLNQGVLEASFAPVKLYFQEPVHKTTDKLAYSQ